MKTYVVRILFAAIALGMLSASAAAAPLLWTLYGVTFSDGGTASGTFVYDDATNLYSAINITTTTGSSRTGATYTFVCVSPCVGLTPTSGGALTLTASSASNLTGLPGFGLFFGTSLTGAGGSIALEGLEGTCSDAVCTAPNAPTRISAGVVTAPQRAIPTLSNWGLLILALLLVGSVAFVQRRQSAR